MRCFRVLLCAILLLCLLTGGACAGYQDDEYRVLYYFTGIGCTHCAQVDPVLLGDWLEAYPDLVVIEYELYTLTQNAPVFATYAEQYSTGYGLPLVIISPEWSFLGEKRILNSMPAILEEPLYPEEGGDPAFFTIDSISFSGLDGYPKIWNQDRILIKAGPGGDDSTLKSLLLDENLADTLETTPYVIVGPVTVALSGSEVQFEHAVQIDNWLFQWRGDPVPGVHPTASASTTPSVTQPGDGGGGPSLTLPKIISLALVDAVNPCALAVLTLMLLAIMTHDPTNRRRVLWAGLAFTASIYICYFIYGLVIIRFFQVINMLTSLRVLLYTLLGIGAILLGLLNLKDFFNIGPSGLFTRMPQGLRSKVHTLVMGIQSVPGAFLTGVFVTLFLLPCTIGPYVIAGGILSVYQIAETVPYLLLYNLIFVVPMIAITLAVYMGIARVEDVSAWKKQNIRYLHGIAGSIMVILGIWIVYSSL